MIGIGRLEPTGELPGNFATRRVHVIAECSIDAKFSGIHASHAPLISCPYLRNMSTSLAQQTADLLDWVENHGYVVEVTAVEGSVEYRAKRQRGAGCVHVGRCEMGDGEHHAYQAALLLTQMVSAEVERGESKRREPAARWSGLAVLFSRWSAKREPQPRTA